MLFSSYSAALALQYEFSLRLLPDRAPLRDVFDALQLESLCGVNPPNVSNPSTVFVKPLSSAELAASCSLATFYVAPTGGSDANPGTQALPFATIARGIAATRGVRPAPPKFGTACLVLRGGVHFLGGSTVQLGVADSGLVITGFAGDAPAWVSGGAALRGLSWTPYNTSTGFNVWAADLPAALGLQSVPTLNTLNDGDYTVAPTRLFRAMYPNYDVEYFIGNLPGMREVTICGEILFSFINGCMSYSRFSPISPQIGRRVGKATYYGHSHALL